MFYTFRLRTRTLAFARTLAFPDYKRSAVGGAPTITSQKKRALFVWSQRQVQLLDKNWLLVASDSLYPDSRHTSECIITWRNEIKFFVAHRRVKSREDFVINLSTIVLPEVIRWDTVPVAAGVLVYWACWVGSPRFEFVLAHLSWDRRAFRTDQPGQRPLRTAPVVGGVYYMPCPITYVLRRFHSCDWGNPETV